MVTLLTAGPLAANSPNKSQKPGCLSPQQHAASEGFSDILLTLCAENVSSPQAVRGAALPALQGEG